MAILIVSLAGAGCAAGLAAMPTRGPMESSGPYLLVLGVAQDAGYPQAGCDKPCCTDAWTDHTKRRHVVSLGLIDPETGQRWMFEATPDFRDQLRLLDAAHPPNGSPGLDGVFLTHAHIGHYTGLMFLGHESMGAARVPVYAMPRMREYLSANGPWDQLVNYENIELRTLNADEPIAINERLRVTPLRVPHREEYSEVVGFRIEGPSRRVLFIPDIDKWERWDRRIEDEIARVDVAYLDGTFFADGEIPNRDMAQIPHPFIAESIDRFRSLPAAERAKVRFIHFNHTNPVMSGDGAARQSVLDAGMRVAEQGERVDL